MDPLETLRTKIYRADRADIEKQTPLQTQIINLVTNNQGYSGELVREAIKGTLYEESENDDIDVQMVLAAYNFFEQATNKEASQEYVDCGLALLSLKDELRIFDISGEDLPAFNTPDQVYGALEKLEKEKEEFLSSTGELRQAYKKTLDGEIEYWRNRFGEEESDDRLTWNCITSTISDKEKLEQNPARELKKYINLVNSSIEVSIEVAQKEQEKVARWRKGKRKYWGEIISRYKELKERLKSNPESAVFIKDRVRNTRSDYKIEQELEEEITSTRKKIKKARGAFATNFHSRHLEELLEEKRILLEEPSKEYLAFKKEQKAELEKRLSHYTLREVLADPSKSAWGEIFSDLGFMEKFSGSRMKRALKNDALIMASFAALTVPHELIHYGVNIVTGGTNEKLVINQLFGGDLWAQIQGIESEMLLPFIGGYVMPETFGSLAGEVATYMAPYILTPAGIYCVLKGKEKDSLALWGVGVGAVGAHLGGIIGDWWGAGRAIARETIELAYNAVGSSSDESLLAHSLAGGFGMIVGAKLLNFTYRTSKGSVNSLRNYFAKSEQPATITEQ